MPTLDGINYFADENCLGMARLLIRGGRSDIIHPGHESIPQIPRETPDLDWMSIVAAAELIVLTRDRHIRTRPAELAEYRAQGVKSVWLGSKRDMTPRDQADMFLMNEARLLREATKRGPGPWALAMSPSGVHPLHLRDS